jgi:hypothetical protein
MTNVCRLYAKCKLLLISSFSIHTLQVYVDILLRMSSCTKLTISSHITEQGCLKYNRPHFSIQPSEPSSRGIHVSEAEKKTDRNSPKTPKSTEEEDASTSAQNDTNKDEEKKKQTQNPTNPLRWFGILVPPALRTAQTTFVGAVEGPIPQLATIARDMKTQEIEIGRVKKQIKKL